MPGQKTLKRAPKARAALRQALSRQAKSAATRGRRQSARVTVMACTRSRPTQRRRAASTRARTGRKAQSRRWSRPVAERSNALDLQRGVFTSSDPRRIAQSLKRSAERSTRRKARPFQSAMSMLNIYINDAWLVAAAESIDADVVAADRSAYERLGARYLRFR